MNGGSSASGAATYSATNGGWNSGTGVFTPTAGNPSLSVTVGQTANVYVDGATTPVFIGRVTNVSSTTVTVSLTAASGTAPSTSATARSIKVGGVWKGPNGAVFFPFDFITNALTNASSDPPRVNFKNAATYNITAAMTHSNGGQITFQGYTSSAGDGGRATFDGGTSGASYALLTVSGNLCRFVDLIFQNNGASGSASGFTVSADRTLCDRLVAHAVRGAGFRVDSSIRPIVFRECEAYACNQSNTANLGGFVSNASAGAVLFLRCVAHDNTGGNNNGFVSDDGSVNQVAFIDCVADTNGASGILMVNNAAVGSLVSGCTLYNNGGDGVLVQIAAVFVVENCVFVSNAGYGLNYTGTVVSPAVTSNAFLSNTSGPTNGINASYVTGSVTLSGDPFVDAANGDFDLNSTAGAGAACRGAGRGSFTQTAASYTGTLSVPDIGASQHPDSGGATTLLAQSCLGARSIGTY